MNDRMNADSGIIDYSIDPHLLKGRARVDEIGKILAIGIRRLLAKQQQISSQSGKTSAKSGYT